MLMMISPIPSYLIYYYPRPCRIKITLSKRQNKKTKKRKVETNPAELLEPLVMRKRLRE